jgi:hypothetical protein
MAEHTYSAGSDTDLHGPGAASGLLSRRQLLQAGVLGATGLAASSLGLSGPALAAQPRFPGMGNGALRYDAGPSKKIHRLGEPSRFSRRVVVPDGAKQSAIKGGTFAEFQQKLTQQRKAAAAPVNLSSGPVHVSPKQVLKSKLFGYQRPHHHHLQTKDLATVTNVLWGNGLYIGNEFRNWSDDQRANNFAVIQSWGFDFVSPKVGGYGVTWHQSWEQLLAWRDFAWNVGLGFAPFIYSIPSTYYRDAQICSQITNAVGVAIVDMEDEWVGTQARDAMAAFGRVYRLYNPNDAIVVTGYGDPITRFGRGVFPSAQMTAWADAYSPQWYYGVWSVYHNYGVIAAINWADNECGIEFGWDYAMCPSFSIYTIYGGRRILPDQDIRTGEVYGRNWRAPIIWWEWSDMNAAIASQIVT